MLAGLQFIDLTHAGGPVVGMYCGINFENKEFELRILINTLLSN